MTTTQDLISDFFCTCHLFVHASCLTTYVIRTNTIIKGRPAGGLLAPFQAKGHGTKVTGGPVMSRARRTLPD